jgi:1-acyl-sn-glycerol-3-phosphate acyltransferase
LAEGNSYRSITIASQLISWLAGKLLKTHFAISAHRPAGLLEHVSEHGLILAPTHQSLLDPWLIMGALHYRQVRALIPLRPLGTQTFTGWLKPFTILIRLLYRVEGVVELPPEEEGGTLEEKIQGLLSALREGDVVMIFPEGQIWQKRQPPIGEFGRGVVYLQRNSGAPIVPIGVWMSERKWPRSRYIIEIGKPEQVPESLDLESGARWLRERTLELHERARLRGEQER